MTGEAAKRTGLVNVSVEGRVGTIQLNRPEASNAIDLATAEALAEAVDQMSADQQVRAVVLTGAGKRFCAGGDVSGFTAADVSSQHLDSLANVLDGALQRLAHMLKPVIAGVTGAVAGAGLGVMLSADVIIAARGTKFVTAYSGIGLTPDCGVSWLLPRAIGQVRALDMLVGGTVVDADRALDWGLVGRVVDENAAGAAHEVAAQLANGPATALAHASRLVRDGWDRSRAEAGAQETRTIADAVTTPEAQELIADFLNR